MKFHSSFKKMSAITVISIYCSLFVAMNKSKLSFLSNINYLLMTLKKQNKHYFYDQRPPSSLFGEWGSVCKTWISQHSFCVTPLKEFKYSLISLQRNILKKLLSIFTGYPQGFKFCFSLQFILCIDVVGNSFF